ncbi:MAG: hypothetical protein AUJ96_28365 [Armatimonadetes bacterium CG2_30_66_41]|nr:MAG: hypothetical protein AUJ96_28365 [Armatimonadetes bacterium CG2_30_66_41]
MAEVTIPEVERLLTIALPLPPHSVELQLAWCVWRRRKRQLARISRYRRRGLQYPSGEKLANPP